MKTIFFYLYELFTVLAPAAVFMTAAPHRMKEHCKPVNSRIFIWMLLFSLYLTAVFHITGAGTLYDIKLYGLELRAQQINLLPFSRSIDVVAYAQNILLFAPLGFLLPVLAGSRHALGNTVLSGLAFSMLIELSQLFNNRSTDVDDLIMNSLGAFAGYGAYKIAARIFHIENMGSKYNYWFLFLYITVLYLGRFFLFNEFAMAKLLYFN